MFDPPSDRPDPIGLREGRAESRLWLRERRLVCDDRDVLRDGAPGGGEPETIRR
jgi:hypothetical protein